MSRVPLQRAHRNLCLDAARNSYNLSAHTLVAGVQVGVDNSEQSGAPFPAHSETLLHPQYTLCHAPSPWQAMEYSDRFPVNLEFPHRKCRNIPCAASIL